VSSLPQPSCNNSSIVEIRDLSFKYYGTERAVLQNVNLTINSGEIVLIAGHSGSGKSTLLRAINGLIPHQHAGDYGGQVIVDGFTVAQTPMSELAQRVGYIFQNPENQIFMFSVERDIGFGLENLGLPASLIRERVDWAMDLLQITQLATRAPHELSDGQKQRVAIAGVIAMQPKILILDEPTSLLDPFTARSLMNLVLSLRDKLGITALIVEHRLDLVAKISDRIIVVDQGKVVLAGTPPDVLSKSDISFFGVTEPTIVKLAKLLSLDKERLPLNSSELFAALNSKGLKPPE
jgi:energy-coupling factor transporter ATP-binding protein EcfA2